jgi:hypothetical protein
VFAERIRLLVDTLVVVDLLDIDWVSQVLVCCIDLGQLAACSLDSFEVELGLALNYLGSFVVAFDSSLVDLVDLYFIFLVIYFI